jgi:23S rRNA (pseudouridine1915-N3)-methyltransferase
MRLRLIAVGTKMPSWVTEGVDEYHKRLPPELKLEFKEIPLGKRGKGSDIQRAINTEGLQMLAAIGATDTVIAMDVKGKPWSTPVLAERLHNWQLEGNNISLLIGGPDGLAEQCLQRANSRWSLSALTLPHPLVRVVLVEQLYRAWTINSNHPYHR